MATILEITMVLFLNMVLFLSIKATVATEEAAEIVI
jgi:hypothetical protein